MAEEAALQIRDLSVERAGRSVLRNITFVAPAGSVTAILGPNGAGKSTLLKAVAGLLSYQGSVAFFGEPLVDPSPVERARRMAFVPQHSRLEAPMDVSSVVAQGRYAHGTGLGRLSRADRAAVDAAMDLTDVTALAARPFNQLSYGERRRVLVARALATEAPVLLLDEPTASLDVAHALALLDLLKRLADKGRCLLTVLHQFDEAFKVAQSVLVLDRGCVAMHDSTHQVFSSNVIPKVFGVELLWNNGFDYRLATGAVA